MTDIDEKKNSLYNHIRDVYPRVYVQEITDLDESDVEAVISTLPAWRVKVVMKYKFLQGRKESATAFALLQRALREVYGITEEIAFEFNEHGKPSLKNHPEIYFNISHCKKAVAVAVSDNPIGIDVEMMGRYGEGIANYVLSDEELKTVIQSDDPDRMFTILWTKKEALLKCIGTGVVDDMKAVLEENKDKKITTTICDGYVYSLAFSL